MQGMWVWSLGWEGPLEKEEAAQASILAWRIQWREEFGGLQSMGLQRVGHNWATEEQQQLDYEASAWLVGQQAGREAMFSIQIPKTKWFLWTGDFYILSTINIDGTFILYT